ncbi:MAG: YcxB family protein [Bacteroidales bacterium]|nr:YcxB family protein [Bacteroidales bacterium]
METETNPLFKISGKLTEEDYVRLCRFLVRGQGKGRRSFIIYTCIFSVFLLLCIIAYPFLPEKNVVFLLCPFIVLAMYLWAMTIGLDRRSARTYRKNKLQADLEFNLSLFEDHYEGASEFGYDNIPYEKLYKIFDTPTNIYLMLAPGQATVLRKEDLPEGALEFIRQIKEKYHL